MTRIKTLSTIAMTFFASLSFMACQKQTPSESKEATNLSTNAQPIKLAYVEVDSIMTRYQFATEYADVLKKKMETIQSTLNNKGLALQKDVADFQNKIQQGSITQEQATAMQSALQKKQAQLQNLQESLTAQYQEMQDTYNKALHDSIQHFLASFNQSYKYDLIISKSGDNILLGNSKMDITDEVIKGLNKRYKGGVEDK